MKKIITTISVLLIISVTSVTAQSCLPEGITFTTQEQIDNFPTNYPECTEIEGKVEIGDGESWTDISNLEGLSSITYIDGGLSFEFNELLTNMEGLNNLDSVGGYLSFYGNTALINFQGFDNLISIGGIYMFLNKLMSFEGLEQLLVIKDDISIIDIWGVENFLGLDNLRTINGGIHLAQIDSFESLIGLDRLTYIGGALGFEDMPLIENLSGPYNLEHLGDIYITGCNSFSGFNGIENIDTLNSLQLSGHNNSLTDLNGLEGLECITNQIYITYCNSLKNLKGIEDTDLSGIEDLTIKYNPLLDSCEVQSICDFLLGSTGEIDIHDNAPGCNSQQEVEEACETVSITDTPFSDNLLIHPNPFTTTTAIEYELKQPSLVQFSIFNQLGQLVYQHTENQQQGIQRLRWDANGHPEGLYYYLLQTGDQTATGKLVKGKKYDEIRGK
ncbi:T9SS type A sorting domain-containing protein [bacterium]|nr:T9SS type A sorting domain-containing protein [bacterium]